MCQRPQTLRNPLPGIRHQPQTPAHSLTNQTAPSLRDTLNRSPRALLREPFGRLPREITEAVADAEREGFSCDYRAGFPVCYVAVGGGFVAPEARQGAEAFGCGERHVDEGAFGVGAEEFEEGFGGGEGHGCCDWGLVWGGCWRHVIWVCGVGDGCCGFGEGFGWRGLSTLGSAVAVVVVVVAAGVGCSAAGCSTAAAAFAVFFCWFEEDSCAVLDHI